MAKLTRKQIQEGLDQVPMDSLLLGTAATKAGQRLTHKQREFARLVALGESKAGAYRKSHNSKGKATTQRTEGYKLTQKPHIANTIEAFAEAQRFAESHTPAQLRAFVVQQLAHHAANAEKDSDKLRALQLLGTVHEVAAYTARSEQVVVKQSGDLRDRIAEKLKLIGASTTIEHNAAQDDEQDAESLLAEIHATGSESPQDDPTAPGTPQNRGYSGELDTHIIPHNRISEFADVDEHDVADGELSYGYSHCGLDTSYTESDTELSEETDAGGQESDANLTGNVTSEIPK